MDLQPIQGTIIIFSHGFGVRKDDRGLLTDIAAALPEAESILFDYFEVDEDKKTITIRPPSVQTKMLNEVVAEARQSNPDAVIDLIAHSQGTVMAALAKPDGIRKAIMLAPVFDMSVERTVRKYSARPGTHIDMDGTSDLGVLDGYTRFVPKEYWQERERIEPFKEYNAFAEKTELIVIEANQDEVVPKVDLKELSPKVRQIPLDGDHNFTGPAREPLKIRIKELL